MDCVPTPILPGHLCADARADRAAAVLPRNADSARSPSWNQCAMAHPRTLADSAVTRSAIAECKSARAMPTAGWPPIDAARPRSVLLLTLVKVADDSSSRIQAEMPLTGASQH